jgi:hypothetical protein
MDSSLFFFRNNLEDTITTYYDELLLVFEHRYFDEVLLAQDEIKDYITNKH